MRLKLLVIPDLFPTHEGDWTGVFVVDYLKCAAPFCDINVFYSRLAGEHVGTKTETFANEFKVTRFTMLNKKPKGLLKLTAYQKWMKASFKEALKLPKPDVIHAHSAVLYGSLGLKLAEHWNVPLVVSEHTGPFSQVSSNALKLKKAKNVMAKADATLAVSQYLANEINAAGIKPKNLIVSGNPVDTDLFTLGPDQLNKNMLFISRLDEFKGGLRTLKAYHSILPKNPEWKLTIGGDGEEMESIKNYIATHKLEQQVKLLGKLTKPQIAETFHQGDFLIFPSVHESFGLIPVEAMAAGLPVISTYQTAPPEYMNEFNGTTIDPISIEGIANAMQMMIDSLQLYSKEQIRNFVVQNYGFQTFGQKLNETYTSLQR